MQIFRSKQFEKQFKKLPEKMKKKAVEQFSIFIENPLDQRLNNHTLSGEWQGYRSINITGDIRAIYKKENAHAVRFVAIGSHSELYQ